MCDKYDDVIELLKVHIMEEISLFSIFQRNYHFHQRLVLASRYFRCPRLRVCVSICVSVTKFSAW